MTKQILIMTALAISAGLQAGCSKQAADTPPPAGAAPAVFTGTRPEGTPAPIPEIRKTARPGDTVLLDGKIMGTKFPFVQDRAVFILGDDATLTSCDESGEEDGCATPWDVCCDNPALRKAGTATIQVLDESGQVLPRGLKGVGGLKELTRVLVAGTVDPGSSEDAFIVNAQAIHVVP